MGVWLFFIFFIIVMGAIVCVRFNSGGHSTSDNPLNANAKIIDIKYDHRGYKIDSATIKTTVIFDDGYEYSCHEFDIERGFLGGKIYISEETLKRILELAIWSHNEDYEKEQKRIGKEKRKDNKLVESKPEEPKNEGPTNNSVSSSNIDKLRKYKSLMDEGLITQEEYDAKRKQLLGL